MARGSAAESTLPAKVTVHGELGCYAPAIAGWQRDRSRARRLLRPCLERRDYDLVRNCWMRLFQASPATRSHGRASRGAHSARKFLG